MGLAGLKKDIERIRADTNKSVLELRGLLGKWDLGNFPEWWGGGRGGAGTEHKSLGVILSAIYVRGSLPTPSRVEQCPAWTPVHGIPCTLLWFWGHSDRILSCPQTVPGSPALKAGSLFRVSVTTSLQAPSHGMKPGSSARRITLTWSSSVTLMNRWAVPSTPLRTSRASLPLS